MQAEFEFEFEFYLSRGCMKHLDGNLASRVPLAVHSLLGLGFCFRTWSRFKALT